MTTTAVQKITGLVDKLLASGRLGTSRAGEAAIVKAIESVLELLETRAAGNPKVREVVRHSREALASMAPHNATRSIPE